MEKHTTTIDDITYTMTTMGAETGLPIFAKLLALFGEDGLEAVFRFLGSDLPDDKKTEAFRSPEVVGRLLAAVARSVSDDHEGGGRGILITKDLCKNLKADKVKIGEAEVEQDVYTHFDTHFSGRYMHMGQVVMWVAMKNFGEL